MIRLLLAGSAVLAIFAGIQSYRLQGVQMEMSTLAADLDAQRAVNQAAAEAAAIHRAHIERLELAEQQWDALERDLQSIGGRDAPLSDNLAAAARRLWP